MEKIIISRYTLSSSQDAGCSKNALNTKKFLAMEEYLTKPCLLNNNEYKTKTISRNACWPQE